MDVSGTSPGSYLKGIRLRLRLGVRDIQQMSSKIASRERNRRFYVSAARLTQIENDETMPSQFKVFTLATIYGLSYFEVVRRYGVDPDRSHEYRSQFKLSATCPVTSEVADTDRTVTLPLRLDPSFKWERTQLINRAVALWGELPAAFLLELNPRQHMYAYIGMEDETMSPLLKPGALVMIDGERRDVVKATWTSEYERPMYLIELRDGYVCSWCEALRSTITIVPHPLSCVPIRSFSLATEAEVIGQVVGVAMRLVPTEPPIAGRSATPSKRS